MISLSLSKIGPILFNKGNFTNVKETLQKMLARKCSYCGKHLKDWKQASFKSLKLPNFFFGVMLIMYELNAFVKIL